MNNDFNLLRPFDLEAAKKGDFIIGSTAGIAKWTYVAGPDIRQQYILRIESDVSAKGEFTYPISVDTLRMAPQAWVEGKPVYAGDVLYWNSSTGKPGSVFTAKGPMLSRNKVIVGKSILTNGTVYDDDVSGVKPEDLTWTKPVLKVKKEGWINIYAPFGGRVASTSHAYESAEVANRMVVGGRIACVRIEWEEEAK